MKDVCFPLTNNSTLCRRREVIDQLKKLVKDVECCDEKSPICRTKKQEDKKSDDPRCYCGSTPGYHHHVMMDGKLAKPVKSEAENTHKAGGRRWCPPCVNITPLMDPIHSCYRANIAQAKESGVVMARNGMPPEEKASAGDCLRTASQQMVKGDCPQGQDAIHDDVFGGQNCPYEHPLPTRRNYYCPEGDPRHIHWSPPYTMQCRYPNTCVASCFQHPALNDWVYQQPKYKCYLQNVNDKPFKKGF